jgi:hypothetical protein
MKKGVFWVFTPCGSCKNRRFGGTWRLVFLRSVRRFLVTVNVVPSTLILFYPDHGSLRSSETSVLTRLIRYNIPEDDIYHSHRHENLESYVALTDWFLYWRRNVSPVKYELGFYIPEGGILHSQVAHNW